MIRQERREGHLINIAEFRKIKSSDVYLVVVSLLGLMFVAQGLALFPSYTPKLNFILLAILAAAAQIATTSVPVSDKAGITFEVGTAVAMASIPFFGPAAAAAIVAFSNLAIWLIKSHDKITWKKSWRQLGFNTGMCSIAMFAAGSAFVAFEKLMPVNNLLLMQILLWILAAFLNTQLNLWLLIIMLRLQHGTQINPLSLWRENHWAAALDILVKSAGGGFLAFATQQYDWTGIVVFFLPIVLSAFAFRLYVSQMQEHMNKLENIITERTQELSELMQEKDAFLAVLTHDMKTPLTTIGLYADILVNKPEIVLKKPHMAQVIRRSQQALTDIVNNILDLENLEVTGELQLDIAPFDLIPALDYLIVALSPQAERKKITVDQKFALPTLMLPGDEEQISRVFQNLLSNAIKYTPEGGHICIEAMVEEGQGVVHVRDTGYGIPANELSSIFERFRRIAKHEKVAVGTGLGLAIVKAIVEAHSGHISVTSQEDVGSTFSVALPL
jgi:signal transduction histidine kinase